MLAVGTGHRVLLSVLALACTGFDGDFCNSSSEDGNVGPPDPSYSDTEIAPEYIRTDYRVSYRSPGFSDGSISDQTTATMDFTIEGHPDISVYSELIPETPPRFDDQMLLQPPFEKDWSLVLDGRVEGGTFEYQAPNGAVYLNTMPDFPDIALPALASIPGAVPYELGWDGAPLGERERVEVRRVGTLDAIAETDTVGAVSITIPAGELQGDSIELYLVRSATYPLQEGPAGGSMSIELYSNVLQVPIN